MDSLLHDRPLLEEACPDERSDFGKGWGEVEEVETPRQVPGAPEKHQQEVTINGNMRGRGTEVIEDLKEYEVKLQIILS